METINRPILVNTTTTQEVASVAEVGAAGQDSAGGQKHKLLGNRLFGSS
jgi:hypothetical protein